MLRLLWWLLRLVVVGPKPRLLAACECLGEVMPLRRLAFGLCESRFCEPCCDAYCKCKRAHVKAVLTARKEVEG